MKTKRSLVFLCGFFLLVAVGLANLLEGPHDILVHAASPNTTGNQTCSQEKGNFLKGVVPGAPVDKQGNITITAYASHILVDSCAQVIRLDLITQPFYQPVGQTWVLDQQRFYGQYDLILRNLSQAYQAAGRPLPEIIAVMGPSFLPSKVGFDKKAILQEARANNFEHAVVTCPKGQPYCGNGDNDYIRAFAVQAEGAVRHFQNCTPESDRTGDADPQGCGGIEIRNWEIWNEPNNKTNDLATDTYLYPSNFAALLSRVYTRLKLEGKPGINPTQVNIISGGLLGIDVYPQQGMRVYCADQNHAGADYLESVYRMGLQLHDDQYGLLNWQTIQQNPRNPGGYPLDEVGQHLYIDQATATSNQPNATCNPGQISKNYGAVSISVSNYLEYLHHIYAEAFPDRKNLQRSTVITEIGWKSSNGWVTQEQQASFLTAAFSTIKTHSYVIAAIWFNLQDQPNLPYGLLDLSNGELGSGKQKTSWSAFQTV